MKKKIIIIIYLINLIINIYSQYNKDLFSIVVIKENEFLNLYKEHDNISQIIEKIPSGYRDIKTTWNTFNKNHEYWIEIEYNGKKGWVNRKYLTRNFGEVNENEKIKIENLLINLTKSLQQKDFVIFKDIFYFLRGIIIYNIKNNKIIKFEYENLNLLWEEIFTDNKNKTRDIEIKNIFENIQQLLECEFDIEYFINFQKINLNIPTEIKNFQFIVLKYKNNTLYIGLEFWNNKPFLSCFCIFYQ